MKILEIYFFILCCSSTKLVEYRFYYNYGQVFHDFSENNLPAVNGNSSTTTDFDSMPTDRGAYFQGLNTKIVLPPNNISTIGFGLPSTFSIIMWIFPTEPTGLLFLRYGPNNYFYIILTGNQMLKFCFFISASSYCGTSSSSAFQLSNF